MNITHPTIHQPMWMCSLLSAIVIFLAGTAAAIDLAPDDTSSLIEKVLEPPISESTHQLSPAHRKDPAIDCLHSGTLDELGIAESFHFSILEPHSGERCHCREPGAARCLSKLTMDSAQLAIVLPGFGLDRHSMLPLALALSQAGIIAVLSDLPGHVDSHRGRIGLGLPEANELSSLVNAITEKASSALTVSIVGYSYGASVGIILGAINASVDRVVAIAPFLDTEVVVDWLVRRSMGGTSSPAPVNRDTVHRQIAKQLGYDFLALSARHYLSQSSTPILAILGSKDVISPQRDFQLVAQFHQHLTLITLEGEGHFGIMFDSFESYRDQMLDWLRE